MTVFLLTLFLSLAHADVVDIQDPDLSFQMVFDEVAQQTFVTEARDYLKRKSDFDPLNHQFPEPIELTTQIRPEMTSSLLTVIEGLTGFRLNEDEISVKVEGLSYQTPSAKIEVGQAVRMGKNFRAPISLRLHETLISADLITIRFHTKRHTFFNKFWIKLNHPYLKVRDLDSLSLELNLKVDLGQEVTLGLSENCVEVFEDRTPESFDGKVDFSAGRIEVSDFEILTGERAHKLQAAGIETALKLRQAVIAKLIMEPMIAKIRELPKAVLDSKFSFRNELKIQTLCEEPETVSIDSIHQIRGEQLFFGFKIAGSPEPETDSAQARYTFLNSLSATFGRLERNEATVAVSIADRAFEYESRKMVECALKSKVSQMNDGKIDLTRIDAEFTESPWAKLRAWLDVHYGFFQWLLLGKKHLHIPLAVEPKVTFTPTGLTIDYSAVDLKKETLLNTPGSNLDKIRFKKIVLRMLRKKVHEQTQTSPFRFEAGLGPEVDLSALRLESDGFGRFTFWVPLDVKTEPRASGYWELLKKLMIR